VPPQVSRRAVVIVTVLLIAVGALWLAGTGAFTTIFPDCTRCHMSGRFAAATSESAHGDLSCTSCHGGRSVGGRLGFIGNKLAHMYLPIGKPDPTLANVPSATCRRCHTKDLKGRVQEANGLRIRHSSCATTRECTDCHSTTAHGDATSWPRRTTMDMCFDCHGTASVSAKCNLCHVDRLPEARIKTGVFAITHGPNHMKTHGMGAQRTCVPCHGNTKCGRCHGAGVPHQIGFVNQHGAVAKSAEAKCMMCHRASFCTDCHRLQMPHPAQFVSQHSGLVKKVGDDRCKRCHDPNDCTTCHVKHAHPVTLDQLRAIKLLNKGGAVK